MVFAAEDDPHYDYVIARKQQNSRKQRKYEKQIAQRRRGREN